MPWQRVIRCRFIFSGKNDELTPDFPTPDFPDISGKNDELTPDFPTPDFPTPDFPTPDFPTPDFPTPDFPTPDFPTPDFPTPDFPTPDFPTPDFPTPDFPTPDFPTPDFPARYFMNICDLSGKRILVTQARAFMGPALCEVFTELAPTSSLMIDHSSNWICPLQSCGRRGV